MRALSLLPAVLLLLLPPGVLRGQSHVVPEVRELRLSNGLEVLCVERPGSGAVHASLIIRGGRSKTGALPPCAADLLGHALFRRVTPVDLPGDSGAESLLREEEGLFEGLRLRGEPLSLEPQGLRQAHERVMGQLKSRTGGEDLLAGLQASRQEVSVEADCIGWSADLPAANLRPLLSLLEGLLGQARLSRLPEERARLMELPESASELPPILLGAASLPGAYGRTAERAPGALESLRWSEMRAYAKGALTPEEMILVLVGDVSAAELGPALAGSLGRLPRVTELRRTEPWAAGITPWEGARKVKATTPRGRRVFMAWRVPPLSHRDSPMLQLLCQMLGAGNGSRLARTLKEGQGVASRVSVRLGVPGGRETNLLVVEAEPAEGRGVEELEQAIQSEMHRLYAEPLREGELKRALRLAEGMAQRAQEDAGVLARALGSAQCQAGDWRSAFATVRLASGLSQESVQAVIRRYLAPSQSLTLMLEPDALSAPKNALEAQLVKVLELLARRRTLDPARVDAIVRDVLQQVRMLPPEERLRTLRLLESQVKR